MRKPALWFAGAAILTAIVLIFAMSIEKVTANASNIALTEQGWQVNFSSPLKMDADKSGDLFVTNSNGEIVKAIISIENKGAVVSVKGLEPGTYTLHVKKDAIQGNPFKTMPVKKFKFTVHDTLKSVATAQELTSYFEKIKKSQESRQFYGLEVSEESSVMEDSGTSAKSVSSDHSTTNNQVEGIDEADMVKTNGDYMYTLLGNGKVTVTDIRNAKNLKVASTISMEEGFYPSQLFLHGDTLVVLGSKYEPYPMEKKIGANATDRIMNPGKSMTNVRMYDVSKPENPILVREVGAEGYLNGARKAGDILYFVSNMQPNFWIMETMDGDLLRPATYDSNEDDESAVLDYKRISILPGTMEPTYSVITAIDLSSPKESKVVTKGYLGASEQLYMSNDNLYLTATNYEIQKQDQKQSSTMIWNPGIANSELFKFTLNGTNVTFHSSAKLKGSLLNQFSMDEHNGYFRVVTTEGNMWDEKNPSKNHLFILDEKLKVKGSVENLAKGERIYSARFMGDKAYMVTFRETDPLFVIDVANPTAPKVLGELKIPGFSNYLHPLDENHLIGFGYETVAKKNPQGGEPIIYTQGMKVSLFDVTDFNNPKEKDTVIIGGRGTYSPVQYDHKALFQHKKRNLYGFPVTIYHEIKKNERFEEIEYQSSGAIVYEITPEKGIVLKADLLVGKGKGEQYGDWEKEVQRLLYSKDALYTVSTKEIKSYSLDSFSLLNTLEIK